MKYLSKLLIVIIIVVVVQIFLNWFFRRFYNPVPQYPKSRICETLRPGITISDLNNALGLPIDKEVTSNGEVWFYFATDKYASVPIKAKVDKETGLVLSLYCDEDGAAWTIKPEDIGK